MYRNYFVKFYTVDEQGNKKQEGSFVAPLYFWQVKNIYSIVKKVLTLQNKQQNIDFYTVMVKSIEKL